MFDLATIDAILKDDYQGPVRDQLNNGTILLSRLQRTSEEDFVGRKAVLPLRKGRNVGVGARQENAALPAAGNQQYETADYTTNYTYGAIKLSGPAIAAAKNNVGAFLRGLESEMKGCMQDIKQNCGRQLWHDGSGILTRCGTTSNSTTVVVESTKFLKEIVGAEIELRVLSDGSDLATARTISSVPSATTFVISGAAVTTSSLHVVIPKLAREVAAGTWANRIEMYGLEAIVSDADPGNGLASDVGGISRDTNLWWRANSVDNGGTLRDLTTDLMQEAWDESEMEGDTEPGLILTSHGVKRRYGALLVPDRRYAHDMERVLDGGYRSLDFNGADVVSDKDASLTLTPQVLQRMYFLSMSSLELAVLEDFHWLDKDGQALKFCTGYDRWEAVMAVYMNLCTNRANANTVLDDIRETA